VSGKSSRQGSNSILRYKVTHEPPLSFGTKRELLDKGSLAATARTRREEGAVLASLVAKGSFEATEDMLPSKEEFRLSTKYRTERIVDHVKRMPFYLFY
jgi:hypothetical protein